jgi:hypothetical protein
MMNGEPEFFPQRTGVFGGDAGNEHLLSVFQNFCRNFNDLFRRLARAKNHFWEILAERPVHVHLRKAKVRHRRGLERPQDFFARDFSGAKLLQQFACFGGSHGRIF